MRVLVVGHERSATSWTAQVLAHTTGGHLINEPDDATRQPFAVRALARRGSLPVLGAEDPGWSELRHLWEAAYAIRRDRPVPGMESLATRLLERVPEPDRYRALAPDGPLPWRLRLAGRLGLARQVGCPVPTLVVKSVRAPLMIDWVRAHYHVEVVVCLRHPLSIVASFLEAGLLGGTGRDLIERMGADARALGPLEFGVDEPAAGASDLECVAWRAGVVMSALAVQVEADPTLHLMDHEAFCDDPVGRFHALSDDLALEWSEVTAAFVYSTNRPGSTFRVHRVAAEQRDRWRARLSPAEIDSAVGVLSRFPISRRYPEDLLR